MKPEQRKQVPCPLRNDRRDRSGSTDGCFGDAALVPERARARAQTSAAAWRRLKGAALAGALAVVAILQGCGSREEVLLGAGLTGAAAGVAGAAGAANNEDDGGAAGVSAKPSVIEFVLVDVGTGLDLRVLNGGERIDVTS